MYYNFYKKEKDFCYYRKDHKNREIYEKLNSEI